MKGEIVGLHPAEVSFLDKVCDFMMHDFQFDSALVSIFAVVCQGEDQNVKKLYQRNLANQPENVDMEDYLGFAEKMSRILAKTEIDEEELAKVNSEILLHTTRAHHAISTLDVMDSEVDGTLCVSVCVYGGKDSKIPPISDFAVALAEALGLFRTGVFVAYGFKIGREFSQIQQTEINLILEAVKRWLKDDKELQFWQESIAPFDRGYFKEPDIGGLGKAMLADIKKDFFEIMKADETQMSFLITAVAYEKQMKKAFAVDEESNWGQVEVLFGHSRDLLPRSYYDLECPLLYTDEQDEEKLALQFSVHLMSETKLLEEEVQKYLMAVSKSIARYAEVWWIVAKPKAYRLSLSQKP